MLYDLFLVIFVYPFIYSKPLVTPCLQIVRMLATSLDIIA